MINYDIIKQLAQQQGITVADLCALAPQNDPFYTGRPSEIIAAEWFADLWQRFGYGRGVHLRRVHYQIVSQRPPATRPDGRPYENTESCWDYLNNASKWARYLGLVSPSAFVDRRNPEANINAYYWNSDDPTPGYEVAGGWDGSDYELPELPELPSLPEALPDPPGFAISGYEGVRQPFHVELWCEKTTMNDVLLPLCRRYNLNLITGAGEMSITAVVDFMRRASEADRPARILYISDFDPAGLGMPISVARKIEFFQRNEGFDALDIRLHPIVLTADQISRYTLPRVPVKDSDLRKASFEAAYGQGQVELDALEALYPGQLTQIVTAAILNYYDPTLTSRAEAQRDALRNALRRERRAVLDDHRDDLTSLEDDYGTLLADFELVREDFAALIADFQPRIDAYQERLEDIKQRGLSVYGTLYEALDQANIDLDDYPLPEPELPEQPETLYDSSRDYLTQLTAYKAQRFGTNGHTHD